MLCCRSMAKHIFLKGTIVLIIFIFISYSGNSQELKASWSEKFYKVKKTSFVPYFDFAGCTGDSLVIVHYGKKGIAFDVFNKSTLSLITSTPVKEKYIEYGGKKRFVNHYKTFVSNNNIYCFGYFDSKKDNGNYPMVASIFDINGKVVKNWKIIGELNEYDLKHSSYDFFDTKMDKVLFFDSQKLFILRQNNDNGDAILKFYNTSLDEESLDVGNNILNIFSSQTGKVWLLSYHRILKKNQYRLVCLNRVSNTLVAEKDAWIPTESEGSMNGKFLMIGAQYAIINDSVFYEYGMNGTSMYLNTYSIVDQKIISTESRDFTADELSVFSKKIQNIDRDADDKERERLKNLEPEFYSSYLSIPSHISNPALTFTAELKTMSSKMYSEASQNGGIGKMGSITYYCDILSIRFNAEEKKIILNWIPKKQEGWIGNEGGMFLSYIPYEVDGKIMYVFLGTDNVFKSLKETTSYVNGASLNKYTRLGYFSVDAKGEVKQGILVDIFKDIGFAPRTHTYWVEGKDLYLLTLGMFKNKIKLVKISPN